MASPLKVFISSTCYDLADLRSELQAFLTQQGFSVSMSEDPTSGFAVDPNVNSIESCLANVESSDVVICILDRRYGGVLPSPYDGLSATEVEIRRAIKLGKPIFYFVRDVAFVEMQHVRREPTFRTQWIEGHRPENAQRLVAFIDHLRALPEHAGRSNWLDQFRSVVELKPLVLKRLVDLSPVRFAGPALHPDRVVRVVFENIADSERWLPIAILNIGIGPAVDLLIGWANGATGSLVTIDNFSTVTHGGLTEGGLWKCTVRRADVDDIALVCQYRNRYADRYRVAAEMDLRNKSFKIRNIKFFVNIGSDRDEWHPVQ